MFIRVFSSAALAGLAAGVLASLLTIFLVVPLILEGELFESGLLTHFITTESGSIETLSQSVSLAADPARHITTLALSLVTYTGFALLMVVGFALAERFSDHQINARTGLIWGIAGFAAVQLAPAAGLPPELPGTVAADLVSRQVWWLLTVALSVTGIALIAFGGLTRALLGILLIVIPHAIGAPHIDTYFGIAPPELAALYASRTIAVAAASWVLLGTLAGWFWSRAR